jgi:hypothetical protein
MPPSILATHPGEVFAKIALARGNWAGGGVNPREEEDFSRHIGRASVNMYVPHSCHTIFLKVKPSGLTYPHP